MRRTDVDSALTATELDELTSFLSASPGAMSIAETRGYLTGILSTPTAFNPSVWQQAVVGAGGFRSRAHAEKILGLLVRLYNSIGLDLQEGTRVAPAVDDETITAWCAGYLRVARMDSAWTEDEAGPAFLFPMAILTGEHDLVGEEDDTGNVIQDAAPHIRRAREILDSVVHEAHRYWTTRRDAPQSQSPVVRGPKTGRNEPCPCGSTKKFKKCCGLAAS